MSCLNFSGNLQAPEVVLMVSNFSFVMHMLCSIPAKIPHIWAQLDCNALVYIHSLSMSMVFCSQDGLVHVQSLDHVLLVVHQILEADTDQGNIYSSSHIPCHHCQVNKMYIWFYITMLQVLLSCTKTKRSRLFSISEEKARGTSTITTKRSSSWRRRWKIQSQVLFPWLWRCYCCSRSGQKWRQWDQRVSETLFLILVCPWGLCLMFLCLDIGHFRKPGYEAEDRLRGGRAVSRSPSGSRSRSVEVSPRWNMCQEADQNIVQRFMGFASVVSLVVVSVSLKTPEFGLLKR